MHAGTHEMFCGPGAVSSCTTEGSCRRQGRRKDRREVLRVDNDRITVSRRLPTAGLGHNVTTYFGLFMFDTFGRLIVEDGKRAVVNAAARLMTNSHPSGFFCYNFDGRDPFACNLSNVHDRLKSRSTVSEGQTTGRYVSGKVSMDPLQCQPLWHFFSPCLLRRTEPGKLARDLVHVSNTI